MKNVLWSEVIVWKLQETLTRQQSTQTLLWAALDYCNMWAFQKELKDWFIANKYFMHITQTTGRFSDDINSP